MPKRQVVGSLETESKEDDFKKSIRAKAQIFISY
jgi:hypothetical protein